MLRFENLAKLQTPVKTLASLLSRRFTEQTGISLIAVSGYRDPKEQERLYAQGRTTVGRIVSWAEPWLSFHNYGLAFDVVPEPLMTKKDWDPSNPLWETLGRIGESLGLEWGGRWKVPDKPHFEFHPGLSIRDVKEWFQKTGEVLVARTLRPEVLVGLMTAILAALWWIWERKREER